MTSWRSVATAVSSTEMWYVVDAQGAYLLDGFSRQVTADWKYAAGVADQTLPEVLRRYDVRRDVYYLPAGRVHSIGTGCCLSLRDTAKQRREPIGFMISDVCGRRGGRASSCGRSQRRRWTTP